MNDWLQKLFRWVDPTKPKKPIDLPSVGMAFLLTSMPAIAVFFVGWMILR